MNKLNPSRLFALLCVSVLVITVTGCHSRIHTTKHFSDAGNLIHKDRTRAYSLFGKSEATKLQGTYDYGAVVDGRTNLSHKVSFGVEDEKKSVDSDGLEAAGNATGNAIGSGARAVGGF